MVAAEFVDDGESARVRAGLTESFDSRPGWRKLRAYLREHPAKRGGPALAVFKEYRRFSRDVAAAHATIRELRAVGVEVQAAEQPIDWSVPEQKLLVGLYLADGEVDNDRRSAAILRGMVATAREGRYTFSRPPIGYRSAYAGRRRVGIEPDPETADAVRALFEDVADPDRPVTEAHVRLVAALGSRRAVRTAAAVCKMLRCRVYIGEVPVPTAARGELGDWLPGVHVPIIGPQLWEAVQARLAGRARVYARRRKVHPELYLRGLVRSRGVTLSGSGSRSMTGARVWYYHGQGRGATRVRASQVHDGVGDWLARHTPPPVVLELFREVLMEEWEQMHAGAADERARAERDARAAGERLARATDLLLDGRIEQDAYDATVARIRRERDEAHARLASMARVDRTPLDQALALISSLPDQWATSDAAGRREIVSSIMPSGVEVQAEGVIELLPCPLAALVFGLNAPEMAGAQNGRPREDGRLATWWS